MGLRTRSSMAGVGMTLLALSVSLTTASAHPAAATARATAEIKLHSATSVADPKLEGGGVVAEFYLDGTSASVNASAEIRQGANVLDTIWSGTLVGGAEPTRVRWDGKDAGGAWCSTDSYTLRVSDGAALQLDVPIALVRLGLTQIDAQESLAGNDTWQMVYFKKQAIFGFYATPAIREFRNVGDASAVSELDLDNGDPRPCPPLHTDTARPVMDGNQYEQFRYNYPLAYLMGAQPRLELEFGGTATNSGGQQIGTGYPLGTHELRCQAWVGRELVATSAAIQPADHFDVSMPALPSAVTRVDTKLTLVWEYRELGGPKWHRIEGQTRIPLRFYTLLGAPQWGGSASGTQYSGPWVEVADDYYEWNRHLGLPANTVDSVTELHVKGFFGQQPGIPTAIENVLYDAYPLGGDGGATHYFNWSTWRMRLSRLLGEHDFGRYVNCTDNMGATTTMLSMMGVPNMRPLHLGNMTLKAIWGIGAPAYTTNLWGSGSHGFSYHHIVTDDGGLSVSDTCMQLDEDGTPNTAPGVPGWNTHRPWSGVGGYNSLSSYNNVDTNVETLPEVN